MLRPYNFAAGPATLPLEVLERIKDELFDWNNTSVSALEIGHRTKKFQDLLASVENKFRTLLDIPDNYEILFLPAGAQGQFSLIPMNLTKNNQKVDYFVTGLWSEIASNYAKKYAQVNIAATASKTAIPDTNTWKLNNDVAYTYYCTNETISGIRFPNPPKVASHIPLIADTTSSILSMPIDIKSHGLVFASSQKNLGIAGVTLVIVRDDLLDQALDTVPNVLSYKLQVENGSCLNTMPVFNIYVMDLMLDWVINQGGVAKTIELTNLKSQTLYQYIDESNFYINEVKEQYRSPISIPFDLPNQELLDLFLEKATANGLINLKGHRLGSGVRACLFNAMPYAGVEKLVEFMQDFAKNNKK